MLLGIVHLWPATVPNVLRSITKGERVSILGTLSLRPNDIHLVSPNT